RRPEGDQAAEIRILAELQPIPADEHRALLRLLESRNMRERQTLNTRADALQYPVASHCGIPRFSLMLDWTECTAVGRLPGKVSGEWLFKDTRVPVRALFENLESGARVDDFLAWFPGVTRDQVEAVLRHAERSLAVV